MGTPIAGKGHTSPLTGSEKIPLSPDGFATTQEVADLGTGGGQTLVIANDEDITVAANPGATIVLYTALTAPRVVNLPPASSASMTVAISDVTGSATLTNTITAAPHAGDSVAAPAINGNGIVFGATLTITNDGVNSWFSIAEDWFAAFFARKFAALGLLGADGPLPTVDPHIADQLWNNAGVVNVSLG